MVEPAVAVERGHGREGPVDVSSHARVWGVVLSGKHTPLVLRGGGGGAQTCRVDSIRPPGGKSHHVIVRGLQVAVAPRLRLVGGGCSQRTFIALLVQPVYGVPDVGRIARSL